MLKTWGVNPPLLLKTRRIKKTEEKNEWFGIVRWHEDDLKSALEEQGFSATDKNVAELYNRLQHHSFTDHMIAAGWDFINDTISNLDHEGNLEAEE